MAKVKERGVTVERDLDKDHIYCISSGLVYCSVCAPKETTREAIEAHVNYENATGISSQWRISDEPFATGQTNPCPCDQDPSRLHHLLSC